MRHPILIDRLWQPLVSIAGGRPARSYLEVNAESLALVFGRLFSETVPRDRIEAARTCSCPRFGGIGWRIGRGGTTGLIGSRRNTVEIVFREPRRVRIALAPFNCRRIVVSLRDPDAFLADIGLRH